MSHLSVTTPASGYHPLLATPSSDSLFTLEVIHDSLTQARDVFSFILLPDLSFGREV